MRLLKQLVAVAAVAFVCGMGMGVSAAQGHALLTLALGVAAAALLGFAYTRVMRWSERRELEGVTYLLGGPVPLRRGARADATATLSQ